MDRVTAETAKRTYTHVQVRRKDGRSIKWGKKLGERESETRIRTGGRGLRESERMKCNTYHLEERKEKGIEMFCCRPSAFPLRGEQL
jgi:hypothetical protein